MAVTMQGRADITATSRISHILCGRIEKARALSARVVHGQAALAVGNLKQLVRPDVCFTLNEVVRTTRRMADTRAPRIFRKREPGGRNASFRDRRRHSPAGAQAWRFRESAALPGSKENRIREPGSTQSCITGSSICQGIASDRDHHFG